MGHGFKISKKRKSNKDNNINIQKLILSKLKSSQKFLNKKSNSDNNYFLSNSMGILIISKFKFLDKFSESSSLSLEVKVVGMNTGLTF